MLFSGYHLAPMSVRLWHPARLPNPRISVHPWAEGGEGAALAEADRGGRTRTHDEPRNGGRCGWRDVNMERKPTQELEDDFRSFVGYRREARSSWDTALRN